MKGFSAKRFMVFTASFFLLWSTTISGILFAQDIDIVAPEINHTVVVSAPAGSEQVFAATITDNVQVADVLFFYRFAGQSNFIERQMSESIGGMYTIIVDTPSTSESSIEYFLRASDTSGTSVNRGSAFQPLVRTIVLEQNGPIVIEPEKKPVKLPVIEGPTGTIEPKKRRSWLYVVGGVLALAVIGAAAGGGGGGGGGEECSGNCSVTFVVSPP